MAPNRTPVSLKAQHRCGAISFRATRSPAIVGGALLGLDALRADREAQQRLRQELGGAVEHLGRRDDG